VADQGGGGRLAVGAGDAEVAGAALGAGQQLDVADDLDVVPLRRGDDRVRLREAVRNARREDQAGDLPPVDLVEIDQRNPRGARLGALVLAVVPGPDLSQLQGGEAAAPGSRR
jgi:hypothetical protein